MGMPLLVSNPPSRSRKRRTKKARRRGSRKGRTPAHLRRFLFKKRRRTATRRAAKPTRTRARRRRRVVPAGSLAAYTGAPPMARRSSRRRRHRRSFASRRRRSGGGRSIGGFVPAGVFHGAIGAAAGFAGSNILLGMLPVTALQTGYGRIAGKALVGLAVRFALKRSMPSFANSFAIGALTAATLDIVNQTGLLSAFGGGTKPPGTSGFGLIGEPPALGSLGMGYDQYGNQVYYQYANAQ